MDVQTVFYYRSDLFRDEQKEKIVDFRNYENDGNWYIFLDEAHKGEKEDSKMQLIFSILSRNGYLNNFSATFVDPRDIITTIYNFNLEKFITNGYGKHIFMFKQDLDAFKNKSEYTDQDKQMTILKTLIILTYNKLCRESLTKIDKTLYYSPLMLVLVNTVNFSQIKNEEGDLKIFFNEIEKIASGNIDPGLFDKAIKELKKDIKHSSFVYENRGWGDKVLLGSIN